MNEQEFDEWAFQQFLEHVGKKMPIIDLGIERSRPVFMSIDEFAAKIEKYSIDDFLNSDELSEVSPYRDLLEASRAQVGLYDQYAAVLLSIVKQKTEDRVTISNIQEKIDFEKMVYILGDHEANSIIGYINKVVRDKENADKVSVLPLMCGAGKSTALSIFILNTVVRIDGALDAETAPDELAEYYSVPTEKDYDGVLIVTDSKERLRKLWNPDPGNKYIDDGLRKFIEDYKEGWVSIMTDDNSAEEERKQRYVPVLCITTQRYFGWNKEEIKKHLEWEKDGRTHKRSLVIFDEQPYLNEVRDISVKTINDIDTALRTKLDNEVNFEDRVWCQDQWNMFRDWFIGLLRHYEQDFNGLDTLYYEPDNHSITEDDDRFFGLIEMYRAKMRSKDLSAYNDLYAVRQWMNTWSIFNHRDISTGEYTNKFTVFIDNREKITDLGAKVIVLDGTGDVSPIYSGQDYIDIRSGANFLRSLSYLTIKLGDFKTSKEDFRKNEIDIGKAINTYLKSQGYERKDIVYFTYMGKEEKFRARVNGRQINNTAHFGDIRGKNDFTDKTLFAQVGLNRMQPVHYLVHVLGRNEDMRTDLARRDPESMHEQIQAIYKDDRYLDFMTAHVLADMDQCMFRSAIRNADNMQNVIYYVFYKHSQYPKLQTAIEKRYIQQLGAHIEQISEKEILDTSGAGRNAMRIHQWLAEWDGKPIKQKNMLAELNMSRDSFNSSLRRDPTLKSLIDIYKQTGREMGYKGATYAKRVQE